MELDNALRIILIFKEASLLFVTPFVTPFSAKDCQGIPKTKIKNVDLTTFYQGMRKRMQRNNGAGGSRTHVQTPANIFVYNHRLCIVLTVPRHITQA